LIRPDARYLGGIDGALRIEAFVLSIVGPP